ncbi:MAG TPA: hypothetical protein VFU15_13420, partial [Bacteroidia bacterium]|nr:hypothetical protein [Bacteroidia bacterium]
MTKHLPKFILALAASLPVAAFAQTTITPFSDQTSLLPSSVFHSGNAVGVCDMNGDFKDDIVRDSMNKQMYIEFQQAPNGTFAQTAYNTGSFGSPWGLC